MTNVACGIGRMNPPTRGHDRLIQALRCEARANSCKAVFFIVDGIGSGKDREKNPLTGDERRAILSRLYGDVTFIVVTSAYEAMEVLDVMGFRLVTLVCGSDRAERYGKMTRDYWGEVKVCSLYRDDKSSTVESVSATKARKAVRENDYQAFAQMFISTDETLARNVWEVLRMRL